ncbi:hypothetical protein M3212_17065 [Alkalihalobacillus oceani]|uniref:hypothetical protein n=1 Tax=Halalkalibacter oceani TaxID=1653776 RepID=UPI00203BF683|nr:hypothetical protein [Halalkalibacter oceani]MCM3762484.1 hypothetical protein [Halalkalibacter oceani]
MYSFFVFVHVVSALFLGSFLSLPFVVHTVTRRTGKERKAALQTIISLTRAGHYALLSLFVTGGWLVVRYSAHPSMLWVGLSVCLLILAAGLIGMMTKRLKQINAEDQPHLAKIKAYSWLTALMIIASLFIMTNRQLFS